MALKTLRIRIKSLDEAFNDVERVYHAIKDGKKIKPIKGTYFESLETVRSVLTENRMGLIRLIRDRKPRSVAELARMAKRDFKHVHGDVMLLKELGLVELGESKQGKAAQPKTNATEIVFRIAV